MRRTALEKTGVEGLQATAKGLRHGYACAKILGGMEIYILKTRLGHERTETTAIYLQVKGQEAHDLQMKYWAEANKNWKE